MGFGKNQGNSFGNNTNTVATTFGQQNAINSSNAFGQQQQQPVPFGSSQQQSQSTNAFGQVQINKNGDNAMGAFGKNQNLVNQTNNSNAFGNSNSGFGQQGATGVNASASNGLNNMATSHQVAGFEQKQSPKQSLETESVLNENEIKAFKDDRFTLGNVPLLPPPQSLC